MAHIQNMEDKTVIREETPAQSCIARIELENGISFAIQQSNLPLTIGRSADSDICIPSGTVSRHHCELYMVNGVLCLKDTSSNGTMVDGRVVNQGTVSIQSGTSVKFAGEVGIRIIPGTVRDTSRDTSAREGDRRGRNDRRQGDRRQQVVIVNFDRRKSRSDRRVRDRRQ